VLVGVCVDVCVRVGVNVGVGVDVGVGQIDDPSQTVQSPSIVVS